MKRPGVSTLGRFRLIAKGIAKEMEVRSGPLVLFGLSCGQAVPPTELADFFQRNRAGKFEIFRFPGPRNRWVRIISR
ncbi:MAG: surfactin synthase thioesterase subunit, partial [Paracoccaceae bacterium]